MSVFVAGQGGGESELCESHQFPAARDGRVVAVWGREGVLQGVAPEHATER